MDYRTSLVVGTYDYPVRDIVWIKASKSFHLFYENWPAFAGSLGIKEEKIKKYKQDILLNKSQLIEVVQKVICDWVGQEGSGASLEKLNTALVDNQLKSISDLLDEDFHSKSTKLTTPSYYVPRTLLARNLLDKKSFLKSESVASSADIFVFTGITRVGLSEVILNHLTDHSTNQIHENKLQIRFMVLDYTTHFRKLCGKTKAPIHWINNLKNGDWAHVRSSDNLHLIRRFILSEHLYQREDEFFSMIKQTSHSICIADSPGMGKSTFFQQMGVMLLKEFPERTVLFLSLSNFIPLVKKSGITDTKKAIESALHQTSCQTALEKSHLSSKLESENIKIELLLDGLDEVNLEDLEMSLKILKFTQSIKSVRLWTSTRLHLLPELEDCLGVFGYYIKPFNKEDQIKFLTEFWTSKHEDLLDPANLKQFSINCLDTLKSRMKEKDEDIAGIPLQCLLIAEVYEENALEKCSKVDPNSSGIIQVNSLTELYQRLVDKKIDKYNKTYSSSSNSDKLSHIEAIKQHVSLALKLLFPSVWEKAILSPNSDQVLSIAIQQDHLLNIGILERSSSITNSCHLQFIHRTFGEFFVGKLIAEMINDKGNNKTHDDFDNLRNIFVFEIITPSVEHTNSETSNTFSNMIQTFRFVNTDICYFVDFLLIQNPKICLYQTIVPNHTMAELIHACANAHLIKLFKFFDKLLDFDSIITIFDKNFLILVIKYSTLPFVEMAFYRFEKQKLELDEFVKETTLCAAAENCNVSVLEYLVKVKQLRNLIENPAYKTKTLLHLCVENTWEISYFEMVQKVGQIRYLVQINAKLLEERDFQGKTPILCKNINIDLLLELIELGADVAASDNKGNTIVHLLGIIELDKILNYLSKDSILNAIETKNKKGYTPLLNIMEKYETFQETGSNFYSGIIKTFFRLKANFNCENSDGESLLAVAIRKGRNSETIQHLISCGANVSWKKVEDGKSLIHYAADSGNIDVLRYLMSEYKMNLNDKDSRQKTAANYLSFAIIIKAILNEVVISNELFLILKEVNELPGVNFFAKYCDVPYRLNIFQYALENQNLKAILYLQESKLLNLNDLKVQRLLASDNTFLCTLVEAMRPSTYTFCFSLMKALINVGAIVYQQDYSKKFMYALFTNSWFVISTSQFKEIAEFLIEKKHARLLCEPNIINGSVLHIAIQSIDFEEDLLQLFRSAKVNLHTIDCSGNSLLFNAIRNCNWVPNLQRLISFGLKITHINSWSQSLLHYAAEFGSIATIHFLISQGLDVNLPDDFGQTPIYFALKADPFYMRRVELLQEKGASPLHLTDYGRSLLHLAPEFSNIEGVKYLLQERLGLDVNAVDENGDTPLHFAVKKRNNWKCPLEIIKLLIESGANVNVKNQDQLTPLDLARKVKHSSDLYEKIEQLLKVS